MEKADLLDGVKRECKKLMEESVTKKFVHTDSSSVTSLCSTVENCLLYKLKKRAGGLLPPSDSSDYIIAKLGKYCDTASTIAKLASDLQNGVKEKSVNLDFNDRNNSESQYPTENKLNGYTSTSFNPKYLWIRVALLEKALTTIVTSLIEYWKEFYEPESLIADKVHGPSLVWLLDGPCSVDFSQMKTPDCLYADPTSYELVQRHHICSSPSMSHTLKVSLPRRRRLFSVSSINTNPELWGVPLLAREHVDSLHQNQQSTLLYGKNNVELSPVDFHSPIQGYLSLHKLVECLLLKWTPNPMLHQNDSSMVSEKSQFWGQVITIDLVDVVYIHCHDAGDAGGSIVLVSQDGVQFPPLSFPTSGSLYTFLTCLDQGLNPDGQLDPPLFNKGNFFVKWPKLRKSIFYTTKIAEKDSEKEEGANQDFVFRIVNKASSSSIDKTELKRLLSINSSPKKLNPMLTKGNTQPNTLIPKLHTGARLGQYKNIASPRVALNLACEKMRNQILSRAFNGWISSYRHLKTVRTHLASLVLPWSDPILPSDVDLGLTKETWEDLVKLGLRQQSETVRQYVYFGGVENSIRKDVWPYLLGHYSFSSTEQQKLEVKETALQKYNQILEECKSIEQIIQEKDKELLALNGFANGETFGNIDMDTESIKTLDITENGACTDTMDNISQDISINSNISDSLIDEKHVVESDGVATFSVIKSLLETRENLREMVDKASERGVSAWKKLVKKKKKDDIKKKVDHDLYESNETFDGLHQKFVPQAQESFDLELDCQKCGKKIIESRSVLDGKLSDKNMDSIECFSCVQERKVNGCYEQEVSPYKLGASPSSVVYNDAIPHDGNDYAIINGVSTPLENRESVSSVASGYSEDLMKDFGMNIHRIDKDVLRCDRNHPYFESEKNLEKLRNIVMCYVWETLNVGYIQGMCDLCAPLLVVMDNEAEVYGCFLKLMERMSDNFPHGSAMDSHLSNIGSLIQILDPELHEILEGHGDCTIFYFCYRWFLLDFKRELQYEDIYLVWEIIWVASSLTSEHFNLFVALAIIELYREIIIDNKMDFTDIIKFFNEMAEQHDAQATLNLARNIVQKLQDIMHPGDPVAMEE